MNNEVKKVPETDPKGYGPKVPAIVSFARISEALNRVITTENGAYIDNVPTIHFDEWHECTHSGCMMLLMNALNIKASYEQLMGVSGSCYRTSMVYGWDFGSNIVHITYHYLGNDGELNAHRAYGLKCYNPINDETRDSQICESIKAGMPVMVLGGRGAPEWSILLGYEKINNEIKFFGRSYFDQDASEDELFTENQYVLLNKYPGDGIIKLFEICDPISPKDALKVSLETCVAMFKPHEKIGFGAYQRMIESFQNNSFLTEFDTQGEDAIYSILINLADARRAASIYLNDCSVLLSDENKDRMRQASALYLKLFNILNTILNDPDFKYEINTNDVVNNKYEIKINNEDFRNHVAGELLKCIDFEHQVQDLVKEILNHWNN